MAKLPRRDLRAELAKHFWGTPTARVRAALRLGDEALDLSQDVFIRVFRTIGQFRGQSALRTWIYRIAVNQARNRHRFWRRRRKSDQVSLDAHVEAHGDFQCGSEVGPDRILAQKELAARLQAGGDQPEDRREHDDQHRVGERVQRPVGQRASRGHQASAPCRSRRNARNQTATQINITNMSSVEAAAPKPNRLLENDCRTISVMIRSASEPGLLPSIT